MNLGLEIVVYIRDGHWFPVGHEYLIVIKQSDVQQQKLELKNCGNRGKKRTGNEHENGKSADVISHYASKRGSLYCFLFKEISKPFSYLF